MFCLEGTNQNDYDRLLRALLATLLVLVGLFWLSSISLIFYVLAAALFINSLTGVCGLYRLLGFSTFNRKKSIIPNWIVVLFFVIIVIILLAGILTKIFLV